MVNSVTKFPSARSLGIPYIHCVIVCGFGSGQFQNAVLFCNRADISASLHLNSFVQHTIGKVIGFEYIPRNRHPVYRIAPGGYGQLKGLFPAVLRPLIPPLLRQHPYQPRRVSPRRQRTELPAYPNSIESQIRSFPLWVNSNRLKLRCFQGEGPY